MRFYLTEQIVTSNDISLMPSSLQQNDFYLEVSCRVSGSVVICPSFVIDSTTDATPPGAKYVIVWVDPKGEIIDFFGEWRVPPVPNPTTIQSLFLYNQAKIAKLLPKTIAAMEGLISKSAIRYDAMQILTPEQSARARANLQITVGGVSTEGNLIFSVNGKTGEVELDADDISDFESANKFVTREDKQRWNSQAAIIGGGNIDGGAPDSIYTAQQRVDGGII